MTKYLQILLLLIIPFALKAQLDQKKVVRWAADSESGAPFVFLDPNDDSKLIGFEADIINAIADINGWELEFVSNSWDGLILGINSENYDLAINGLEITPDRQEKVEFSIPYYYTYEQLVVRAEETSIESMEDLTGKYVGTLNGSLAQRILEDQGDINVRPNDSEVLAYQSLKNGNLDAVLIDQPVALYYASWNKELKLIDDKIDKVVYGIVIKKGNLKLLKEVNHAIRVLKKNGKLREIYDSWNLWNDYMKIEFNDYTESSTPPKNFNDFIEDRGIKQSFLEKLWSYNKYVGGFAKAAIRTLQLSIGGMTLAIILGLFFALVRTSGPKPLRILVRLIIEFIRGTPLLIQLILIFYGLPEIGIKMPGIWAGIIGLGLNYSAYEAEVYRTGLFAVRRGQMEAAISLGMNKYQAMRFVIVPQAVRIVIPPVTNDFIALLKDSSIVSLIMIIELTKRYTMYASANYDYIGLGIIVSIIYLLIGLPFVKLSSILEKKFSLENINSNK